MENITKKRLKNAGWKESRDIDISIFSEKYKEIDLNIPINVKRFLRKYGGLIFEEKDMHEDVRFIPNEAIGSNLNGRYFETVLEEYDILETAYPIGVCCRENLILLMTENNEFYCFTDGYLERNGKNVDEMLDCIVGECREAQILV